MVSDDGLILTNAHVVAPEFIVDELVAAVTTSADLPPVPTYRVELRAVDHALDLALVQAVETIDGEPFESGALPTAPLGNSDEVSIGDGLVILGYPVIGGETVTLTRGYASGFTSDLIVGERAWIKTDGAITGGNSGGAVLTEDGRLIGVPSSMGLVAGSIVDCRQIQDTNRDGTVGPDDDCVPLGGFLNGIRPVNLAIEMMRAVEQGEAYEPLVPDGEPPSEFDIGDIDFSRPRFSSGTPPEGGPPETFWLEGEPDLLCAWWDYAGMANGVRWDAFWSHEGVPAEQVSTIGEIWIGGSEGEWWTCISGDPLVAEGIWDLSLHVAGERINGSFVGIGLGSDPITLTVTNGHDLSPVCYVFLSPRVTTFWGDDWLGEDDALNPGESRTFDIPPTTYDVRLEDCARNVLFEEVMTFDEDATLTYE